MTISKLNQDVQPLEIISKVNEIIDAEEGSTITVDSALSTTSENPVQNKVITGALNNKQESSTAVTHTASTAVGSATQPVYIASDGTATETTYSLAKSVPSDAVFTDTTYSAFVGADGTDAGESGLVPAPVATDNTKYLKGDGTWDTPPGTAYNDFTGADGTHAGTHGLVPAPSATDNTKFLRGDGAFATASVMPSSTTSSQTPTNNAEYTAPWDGYYTLVFSVDAGKSGDALLINMSNNMRSYAQYTGQVVGAGMFMPITKGQKVKVIFTSNCIDLTLIFTYANTYVGS